MVSHIIKCLFLAYVGLALASCSHEPLNNPYQESLDDANTYYTSFSERPKTLDPARSYTSMEALFISQIYEPPLQYHYLKRPYQLEPLAATSMPQVSYFNKQGQPVKSNASNIAETRYTIHIKDHIYYQPHPALAKDAAGNYFYHNLNLNSIADKYTIGDFKNVGTRELIADDYVYQIKRLAHPALHSPILGLMSEHIIGLRAYARSLQAQYNKHPHKNVGDTYIDLRQYPLTGVRVIDRYTYQIRIKGQYPQFRYWLAMSFFGPLPWEADRFYRQVGMEAKNISLDWYPIGTGPYELIENNPNRRIVLIRNPNFHGETYPDATSIEPSNSGLLTLAGQPLPFINKFVFSLEKEAIPRWHKFLQGYYDESGISSDSFDQAIKFDAQGKPQVTRALAKKRIKLQTTVAMSSFYLGFNMLDEVVGTYSERARLLRQAISIAIDYEEYIALFLNGRGQVAQSPLPPGIFAYREGKHGLNSVVYRWHNKHAVRRSIDEARRLMAQAGYANGIDPKSKQALMLYLDVASQAGPDDKARFAWFRKQFQKLGIQLQIRVSQYNRFQEKINTGHAQLFLWGWAADYPDPENFLFLLYGPNAKVKYHGENTSNYENSEYDRLFEKMKVLPDSIQRQAVIDRMIHIIQRDAPWVWGFHPLLFKLSHVWMQPAKVNDMARNTLKYLSLNASLRTQLRRQWNAPILWPLWILMILCVVTLIPVLLQYWRKEHGAIKQRNKIL